MPVNDYYPGMNVGIDYGLRGGDYSVITTGSTTTGQMPWTVGGTSAPWRQQEQFVFPNRSPIIPLTPAAPHPEPQEDPAVVQEFMKKFVEALKKEMNQGKTEEKKVEPDDVDRLKPRRCIEP